MKVKELIAHLEEFDGDRLVVLSRDPEGNGFSPLADVSDAAYEAETPGSGWVGIEELTSVEIEAGFTEDDVKEDGVPALVLWPTR
jgi:hypothetical protein